MLIVLSPKFKFGIDRHILIPFLAVCLRLIPVTADLSYIIVALYSLTGRRQIIESIFLSWFFTFLNNEITPPTLFDFFNRYLIILTCFISVLIRANLRKSEEVTIITTALGIFFIIHSIFFSQIPELSILKASIWILYIVTLLLAWNGMSYLEYNESKRWIVSFIFIIVLASLFIFFFSDVGYSLNSSYFQGILNHPQALGLTAAGSASLIISQLLSQKSNKLYQFLKIFICFYLIFLSGSRTAALALIFALSICLFIFFITNFNKIISIHKISFNIFKFLSLIIFLVFIGIFIFQYQDSIGTLTQSFINKTEKINVENIFSAYFTSRKVLFEPMLMNIFDKPFSGIGFGIASDPLSMNIKKILGIPISAPIEKGILPLAILEEVGVFGLFLFIVWIFILLIRANTNSFGSFFILITLLMFNLGEAGLFSPNGFGMLYLILLTLVVTKPIKINK